MTTNGQSRGHDIVAGSVRQIGHTKHVWLQENGQVVIAVTAGMRVGLTPEEALALSAWLLVYGDALEEKTEGYHDEAI